MAIQNEVVKTYAAVATAGSRVEGGVSPRAVMESWIGR